MSSLIIAFKLLYRTISFSVYVLYEIIVANLRVAHAVLLPGIHFTPALIRFPLQCTTNFEITTLANIISLTPGTLVLDINEEKTELLVHTMFHTNTETMIKQLKSRFEKPVLRIFNPQ